MSSNTVTLGFGLQLMNLGETIQTITCSVKDNMMQKKIKPFLPSVSFQGKRRQSFKKCV